MEYQVNRKFKEFGTSCGLNVDWRYVTYKVQTELNNLSAIVTKGSDVGYKNVTVTEQGRVKQNTPIHLLLIILNNFQQLL